MYQRQKAFLLKTAYAAAVLAVGWLILRYALVWLLPFLLALGFAALTIYTAKKVRAVHS